MHSLNDLMVSMGIAAIPEFLKSLAQPTIESFIGLDDNIGILNLVAIQNGCRHRLKTLGQEVIARLP